MSCREWEIRIRPWLDRMAERDEVLKALPQEIAEHARACGSCSRRLNAALLLFRGTGLRREPDPGLATRVSERLAQESGRRRLIEPRFLRFALAAAVLAVALTVGVVVQRFLPAKAGLVEVHLVLQAPQARTVSVVGDWNDWDPNQDRLRDPDGDGTWEISLRLHKGEELRYQFLIDGERWVADPQAPLQIDDGFGGTSSVLQI